MFAEFVFASFLAAGGPGALDSTPTPQPAVMRYADAGQSAPARIQLAADLGCPGYYDRGRGYGKRCHRRRADPYEYGPRHRGGRFREGRYLDGPRGHSEHGGRYDGGGYRGAYDDPRDTLRDPRGRPYRDYRDAEPRFDEDAPAYRRGSFDEPGPRDRYDDDFRYDDAPYGRRGEGLRPFREGSAQEAGQAYYQSASYREPFYKKKDTGVTIITTNRDRNADFAVGLTV